MLVTQKKQYALRAMVELGKNHGSGPVKAARIAATQDIPIRFLEVILGELKRKGLVGSKRGFKGGYTLLHPPGTVTVGTLFRSLEDSEFPENCIACSRNNDCALEGHCVFISLWQRVRQSIDDIYDQTTLQDLIDA